MHKWGGTHIGGLAAPRSIEPRVPITPRTLRSVSLSHPLSSLSDEVVKAPNVWAVRRPSNDKIVSMLTGCAENTPRLTPFDRTRHQPRQDVTKATSYVMDYCRPASVRSSMHSLPPPRGALWYHRLRRLAELGSARHIPFLQVRRASERSCASRTSGCALLALPARPARFGPAKGLEWTGPGLLMEMPLCVCLYFSTMLTSFLCACVMSLCITWRGVSPGVQISVAVMARDAVFALPGTASWRRCADDAPVPYLPISRTSADSQW